MSQDVELLRDFLWQEMCELPDRTSPEEHPDTALVSLDELTGILEKYAERFLAVSPPMRDAGGVKVNERQLSRIIMLEVQGKDFGRENAQTGRFTCSMAQIDLLEAACNAAVKRILSTLEAPEQEREAVEEGSLAQLMVRPGDILERVTEHDKYSIGDIGTHYTACEKETGLALCARNGWTTMHDRGRFRRVFSAASPVPSQVKADATEAMVEAAAEAAYNADRRVAQWADWSEVDEAEPANKALKDQFREYARAALSASTPVKGEGQ